LAKVGSVNTQKSLLSWITNSSDLGVIQISGVEAAVQVADGTTDLEQALAPILEKSSEVQR
jgi:hypothetical protein